MKNIELRGNWITVPESMMTNQCPAEETWPDDNAEREALRRAREAVKMEDQEGANWDTKVLPGNS